MGGHIENSLPAEIMAQIFELGYEQTDKSGEKDILSDLEIDDSLSDGFDFGESEGDSDDEGSSNKSGPTFAMAVSHVCRRWRQTALATPSLWSKITFTPKVPSAQNRTFLERSRNSPLELFLHFAMQDERTAYTYYSVTDDGDDGDDERIKGKTGRYLKRALDLTIPHASRWRALHARASREAHMDYLLNRLEPLPGAPLLQTLELYCHEPFYHNRNPKMRVPFSNSMPRLADLTVDGAYVDLPLLIPTNRVRSRELGLSAQPGITNLTNLELSSLHTIRRDVFIDLLRCSPKLSSLTLALDIDPPSENEESCALLPGLKHLSLIEMDCDAAVNSVACFYAPSLMDLRIKSTDGDFDDAFHELARSRPARLCSALLDEKNLGSSTMVDHALFAQSMMSTIKYLELIESFCQDDTAHMFLECCTSLERLKVSTIEFIEVMWGNADLQEARATDPTMPPEADHSLLCPRLKDLTIGYDTFGLEDFLRRRKDSGAEIRKLTLLGPPHLDLTSPRIMLLKPFVRRIALESSREYEDENEDKWYTTDDDAETDDLTDYDEFGESD